ncbi:MULTISPECIES: IMPACT family protein [unclassified Mucilaginibacter]|uniref:IMPACT family protein n=1 Tax=unclassified Mucilaginibacter TaxID=2617802 RepID=UPI0009671D08|nr:MULTISPECIES: YigZ family protein [unclassified Mucilaginibacter]HEK21875.1 YigZ family protein [Bacteroidota bacterium]OJW18465.1 MAG: YigZ family protein [Mucilaginibacter sp. 44-25]PLW89902.1 MAG: YigZ family protein [Mucilaginibacter sp.]PMP65606.1 MAG: YigZ family protein [Mucilaginibacter sp.]PMP65880.1 MAG: YigZ family protein [Mucilaginibacter sp.]
MLFDDTYKTISASTEAIFRDRGSKFIAFAYPISGEADIKPILTKLKAEHPKANHHCWAMRLGTNRSVFRVNDDGEPSGTAGRPILNTLLSKDITNTLVVVVRYFGGTLLGVPGLINAYKTATEMALSEAIVIEKTINDMYTITFDYPQMNDVMRIIKEEQLQVLEQRSELICAIRFSVRKTQVEVVMSRLGKLTGAKIKYDYSG